MTETRQCTRCGAVLPEDAPAGLCPACLLGQGLDSRIAPTVTPVGSESARFVPPSPAEISAHFPQFEIVELIGQGGMGAVYKARQPQLDRLVALKILPPDVGRDPAFAERFTREARALARLTHPHIVTVYEFGRVREDLYFLAMEYVDGVNLRQMVAGRQLAPEQALAIVPQICEALQFAHEEGVVHRDIKPENILVDKRGRVKIADFGLAKILDRSPGQAATSHREGPPAALDRLTYTGQVMGTLHYMAPEQLQGKADVDHRADIYSLGVVFYEMLTGELPIGRFEPPSHKVQIDVRLDEVVLRTLESNPDRRYQQAGQVKTDVDAIRSRAAGTPAAGDIAALASRAAGSGPSNRADAHRRLRAPASALILVGLAMLVVSLVGAAWAGMTLGRIYSAPASEQTTGSDSSGAGTSSSMKVTVQPHVWRPYVGWFWLLLVDQLAATAIGGVILLGGSSLRRMESLELGRLATALAMIPASPVWLAGLPVAIWCRSVLGQKRIAAAFDEPRTADEIRDESSRSAEWRTWIMTPAGAGFCVAIVGVVAACVPWAQMSIFAMGVTMFGIDSWNGQVSGAVCLALLMFLVAGRLYEWGRGWTGAGLAESLIGGMRVTPHVGPYLTLACALAMLALGVLEWRRGRQGAAAGATTTPAAPVVSGRGIAN